MIIVSNDLFLLFKLCLGKIELTCFRGWLLCINCTICVECSKNHRFWQRVFPLNDRPRTNRDRHGIGNLEAWRTSAPWPNRLPTRFSHECSNHGEVINQKQTVRCQFCVDKVFQSNWFEFCSAFIPIKPMSFAMVPVRGDRLIYFLVCDKGACCAWVGNVRVNNCKPRN